MISPQERYRGSLLGLACGDALGAGLEGRKTGSFQPMQDMAGGDWTDDTSMALCLADSLVTLGGFDPVDQLTRYVRWLDDGYLSATGVCYGIGGTTKRSLKRFKETRAPYCGPTEPETAGNGSIMRLAPVPLAYSSRPEEAVARAAMSSLTTHGAVEAVDACRYMASILVGILNGASKEEALGPAFAPADLAPGIAEVASGSFLRREPPEIKGTGFSVRSLEASLWAFSRAKTFREGALLAVNLGDDADTTGAIYGQIAGAFYGEKAIPEPWLAKLAKRDVIERLADRLLSLAGSA